MALFKWDVQPNQSFAKILLEKEKPSMPRCDVSKLSEEANANVKQEESQWLCRGTLYLVINLKMGQTRFLALGKTVEFSFIAAVDAYVCINSSDVPIENVLGQKISDEEDFAMLTPFLQIL